MLGHKYKNGQGVPLNRKKALALWSRAAKFGSVEAQFRIASAHFNGDGILAKISKEKAKHHWKLAAIGGHELAI